MVNLSFWLGVLGNRFVVYLFWWVFFVVFKDWINVFVGMMVMEVVEIFLVIFFFVYFEGLINWMDGIIVWFIIGFYDNGFDIFMGRKWCVVWFWVVNEMFYDLFVWYKMVLFWYSIFVIEEDCDWFEFDLFRLF